MAEPTAPRTPTPTSRSHKLEAENPSRTITLTPPPSNKHARTSFEANSIREPTSPTRPTYSSSRARTPAKRGSFGSAMPSPEKIQSMSEYELRDLANDIVPALGEVRMELAHTKLQYQLLSIETREAAERAEVEHDMTRKEVEVLQAGCPIIQSRAIISPDPRSALAQIQHQLEASMLRNQELESNTAALELRLRDAKRVIKYLDGQNFEVNENNKMLRERIRDNREHLDAMRSSGLLRSTPSSPKRAGDNQATAHGNHYATPARARRPHVRAIPATPVSSMPSTITPNTARPQDDPFGALLFAGEVLNAQHQRASVPSTPSPTRTMRQQPSHSRGTHSLSSLPVTPRTSRLQPEFVPSPLHQGGNLRHERRHSASTISDSSSQEDRSKAGRYANTAVVTEEELPASQASQAASDLLRRYPGPSSQERPSSGQGLIQTKLTGKIVKGNKRSYDSANHDNMMAKKQKLSKQGMPEVGLGIGVWPSPAR